MPPASAGHLAREEAIAAHVQRLRTCRLCPEMHKPVVVGRAVASRVLLVGQAPGVKEPLLGRPFAWTAGRTMFRWFEQACGISEEQFRERVYMAAVCRCFPGKNPRGGDRVPNSSEIANCSRWLDAEIQLLEPKLVLAVGKLAIAQFLPFEKLSEVVGRVVRVQRAGREFDLLPLPHPSGASTWHRMEPGKSLLAEALNALGAHPAMRDVCAR